MDVSNLSSYSVASVVLLSLPTLYLLLFPGQSTKVWNNNIKTTFAEWRKNATEFNIFLPILVPKDRTLQRKLLKSYAVIALCLAANRAIKVITPMLLRRIIDILNAPEPAKQLPWVEIVLFILFRKILSRVADNVSMTYRRQATNELSDNVTLTLYNKLMSLTAEFHENKKSGSVWKAVTDSGLLTIHYFNRLLIHQLPILFDIVLGIGACWKVFDGRMAFAMVAVIVIYVSFSLSMPTWNKKLYDNLVKLSDNASDVGHDTLLNWQTVVNFNRVQYENLRYKTAVYKSRESFMEYRKPGHWRDNTRHLIASIGVGAICVLGCHQIQTSNRSAGDFVMLFQFWSDLFSPLDTLIDIFQSAERFLSDSHKFLEIIKLEPDVKDKEDTANFKLRTGSIEFENVTFSYDGKRDAVKDVSFKIEGGSTVAIVGETGGGKSTLFKLLCRAYDVTGGSIKIDGQDLRDVRLESLREHIGIVPQAIGVFNTTIFENLRYANLEATMAQVEDACRAAALHKRIMSFPNGYEEVVGEKGSKLSGGELQRLAIARALLRKSQIVLFDEATSNLDAETESRIQDYLKKWYAGRTVVVVAHRLATIANSDLIISFKDGVVVEAGRHDELLAKQGYFYQLWNKQRLQWDPTKKLKEESASCLPIKTDGEAEPIRA
ncbi:P-loop containing nucleoside triphosphate hydrolase protein [Podospora didyma]|uniref:P-loop containing nucleoside triphosphate hydrolase protein n=1 Tax=Podospora didyma TaxID=330526 RepID=A0AAE0JZZ1_9PEZI|nr:P-loop containing nucleoside triphosphate hydrolase protein [Podospora didyma]